MIPLEKMTDEQFARHVLELLSEGLGSDGMARFLSPIVVAQVTTRVTGKNG